MANKPDFKLPFNDLTNYVPKELRNPVINALIDNLFNRFMTHDESVPFYGYIGRKPSAQDDKSPRIPQKTAERDINAITPVFTFNVGSEKVVFTPQDIVNKAASMGIGRSNDQTWLYSQSNNFVPPIDLDKFANFFNYYWVANVIPTPNPMPWNEELLPEYYTIARPSLSDNVKLNVAVATVTANPVVLTGTGFKDQVFTVRFLSSTQFIVEFDPTVGLGNFAPSTTPIFNLTNTTNEFSVNVVNRFQYTVTNQSTFEYVELLTFDIVRDAIFDNNNNVTGYTGFAAGDTFSLDVTFLSRNYSVSFSGSAGVKGKLTNVKPLSNYQKVDGVQLSEGMRVLVRSNSPDEDGIYVVHPQGWVRAEDFSPQTAAPGARVFVREGLTNGKKIFSSVQSGSGWGWQDLGVSLNNTNDWQETNYWVHVNDLPAVLGNNRSKAIQAIRPIIEFSSKLQLNTFVNEQSAPDETGFRYEQTKQHFNQIPLFDLYRYDGTHANLVSGIFFYVEDPSQEVDVPLQKRLKKATNSSSDFVFSHGAHDSGSLLFFKDNGELKTVWAPGATELEFSSVAFTGAGVGECVVQPSNNQFAQPQIWTLEAVSESTFKVYGTKTPTVPEPFATITVGVPYDNGDFQASISGTYEIGDKYVFRIDNLETPRYLNRDADGSIQDLFGGADNDSARVGAWQVSRTFYHNPYNEVVSEIPEGTLYSHFRGILSNRVTGIDNNDAVGGMIKLWGEQHTLFASLMMQRDSTPISMISFAKNQYESALSAVRDIFFTHISEYVENNGMPVTQSSISSLVDFILSIRANDNDVKTVLFDSTSGVVGFPISLAGMGLLPAVQPQMYFDNVIGQFLIQHHDGHVSPAYSQDADFIAAISNPLPNTVYAPILNEVILEVETRLFNKINPNMRVFDFDTVIDDELFQTLLKKELYTFAAQNGYDPMAPDYVASNPFTWNYSSTGLPARWYDIVVKHQ